MMSDDVDQRPHTAADGQTDRWPSGASSAADERARRAEDQATTREASEEATRATTGTTGQTQAGNATESPG